MPQIINIKIVESEPINVVINEANPTQIASIFEPDEDGKRIVKVQVKNGKLDIQYEGGE